MAETTQLYRHFDANDKLLYVGVSKSAFSRFVKHIGQSEWSGMAVKMTVENYPSRDEALAAEAIAIRADGPVWNKQHAGESVARTHGFLKISLDVLDELGDLSFRSPATRRLLTVLLRAMNRANQVKFRQAELVVMTGLSRPSIQRAVVSLKDSGWLSVKKDGTSNIYEMNPDVFVKA